MRAGKNVKIKVGREIPARTFSYSWLNIYTVPIPVYIDTAMPINLLYVPQSVASVEGARCVRGDDSAFFFKASSGDRDPTICFVFRNVGKI